MKDEGEGFGQQRCGIQVLLRTDAARSRSHDPSRPRAIKSVGVLAWGARLASGVVVGDVVG